MPQIRPNLTDYMTKFFAKASQVLNRSDREALEHLLLTIEILARNGKLDVGLEWTETMRLTNGEEGIEKTPKEGKEISVNHSGPFDISILETNPKVRSGFVGVYANGNTFRVQAFDQATGATCASNHPTALAAAIARFRWHEEHGIPYGNVARYVDDFKKKHPEWSVEKCLLSSWEFFDSTGKNSADLKWPFTESQIRAAISNYRKANKLPDPPLKTWNEIWEEPDPRVAEAIRKSAQQFEEAGLDSDLDDEAGFTGPE